MGLMDLLPRTKTREEILANREKERRSLILYLLENKDLAEDKVSVLRFLLRKRAS